MQLGPAFRRQAEACAELGSPMYADLLGRVADALLAGGEEAAPFRAVLAGHEDDPGPSAIALRLMGSVHRLVLERRAPALALHYPSVGGTWEAEGCWTAFRDLVADQPAAVREWLDRPPQTNEVGRAAGLLAGLLEVVRRTGLPVRLVEIGSSGGLNLLGDRFRFCDDTGAWHGDEGSPVALDGAWTGPGPWHGGATWPEVVERVGSDLRPVDATGTEGRLVLTAYVWADMRVRLERLRGALRLAQEAPVEVRRAGARDVVDGLELVEGTVTVLWHSVMWQYLDDAERADVLARTEELGAASTPTRAFAHLQLEPRRRTAEEEHAFWLVLRTWPGGVEEHLARSRGHGLPVDWGH
ncbi:DUF2332 domain-containing protein [Nocardioides litoris]|uniref:DUF2332 domain-containing protein n=1 Tax=Nocardioides litoris TaxID=1926648 RepID=UPI0011233814|nr:DUF2332 domain-containing protein [Nocardioides litoris]